MSNRWSAPKRRMAFSELSAREYALVRRLAKRDGITIANFIRRCINGALLEEGLDDELLDERTRGGNHNPTGKSGALRKAS